jgi:hypothetical protein
MCFACLSWILLDTQHSFFTPFYTSTGGSYQCCHTNFFPLDSSKKGCFILLPLLHAVSLNVEYPMLFIVEDVNGRATHCGVLEFLAEEGVVYMPHWVCVRSLALDCMHHLI